MINKERVQLWVDALRDPSLKQGQHYLATRQEDGTWKQCCMDVACRVAMANGLPLIEATDDEHPYAMIVRRGYLQDGEVEFGVLPHAVRAWYGLTECNPDVFHTDAFGDYTTISLGDLNDSEGATFPEIADLITASWLEDRYDTAE
jgi:hypothetical protein